MVKKCDFILRFTEFFLSLTPLHHFTHISTHWIWSGGCAETQHVFSSLLSRSNRLCTRYSFVPLLTLPSRSKTFCDSLWSSGPSAVGPCLLLRLGFWDTASSPPLCRAGQPVSGDRDDECDGFAAWARPAFPDSSLGSGWHCGHFFLFEFLGCLEFFSLCCVYLVALTGFPLRRFGLLNLLPRCGSGSAFSRRSVVSAWVLLVGRGRCQRLVSSRFYEVSSTGHRQNALCWLPVIV